jgi:hypothetical protein
MCQWDHAIDTYRYDILSVFELEETAKYNVKWYIHNVKSLFYADHMVCQDSDMDIYKRERLILGKISFHHKTRVIFWRGQRVLCLLF